MNQVLRRPYLTKAQVHFHQADPAGIMFFGHIYTLAHNAHEQYIEACGYSWKQWFLGTEFLIPIRHSEADYLRPFRAGEFYDIEVGVYSHSKTSFKTKYLFKKDDQIHGIVRLIHTCIDPKTFQKTEIPSEILEKLTKYLLPESEVL